MRAVLACCEFGNTLGIDVEAQRVEVFAELHGEGQADVAQADDGDTGVS
jgi:hypothetical protein